MTTLKYDIDGIPVVQREEQHIEAVRTTKHPLTKVSATQQKGPQNRRHPTCKVARETRSHDFYDVNVALYRLS